MKFKRSHAIVSTIIAVAAIYYGWWFLASGDLFHSSKRNTPNRAALLQVYEAVGVGASHSQVLSAYWQHRTDSLRLFADRPAGWVITMPLELGASDWKLLIEFQDGRVSAVRVRTSDGPPPKDGPKDKQKDAANKGAAPNAGGRRQFPIRTPLAARVGELGRSAARAQSHVQS